MIHQGDLIAATSGRAIWILDDLSLLEQYNKEIADFFLYQPESAYLANGRSKLDKTDLDFNGMSSQGGVNPANGMVIYFNFPETKAGEILTLDIKDAEGSLVRTFTSKKDSLFTSWDGGPSEEPVLPTNKGLNRLVWDMRYPSLLGIKDCYFEASYAGHKASPGNYSFTLNYQGKQASVYAEILANPLYPTTAAEYAEYHRAMFAMETNFNMMQRRINTLHPKQEQLEQLLATLSAGDKYQTIRTTGHELINKMSTWDEDMVQRKSKAYDDVENFPNKFTANYLFLINQTESDIPSVNQPSLDLRREMEAQWEPLLARVTEMLEKDVPELNKLLWEAGIGGVWK